MDNTGTRAILIHDRDVPYAPRAGPLPLPCSSNEMGRYVAPGVHGGWPTRLGIRVGDTTPCGPSPATMCPTGAGDYTDERTELPGLSPEGVSTTSHPAPAGKGEYPGIAHHTPHSL